MKRLILRFLERTGDPALIDFKLHDFGFRGVSSVESAGVGGAAHLVNFQGTDTLVGILLADRIYGAGMAGFSIPAAEHSTMTAWGRDREEAAYANMIRAFPAETVAVVSDSYDIEAACRDIWGGSLRGDVLSRRGRVVVRADSGDPATSVLRVLDILGERFGSTTNAKGYKLLPPQIAVIQGDGVDYEETERILTTLEKAGWSADNIGFGMGGGLLQKVHRDTQEFAFKCSMVTVDGVARDVFKQPAADRSKASKPGRLKLVRAGSSYRTVRVTDPGEDLLVEVFRDGRILRRHSFDDVRARAAL
jgi:nicotinamide phosphoribosyltransferase